MSKSSGQTDHGEDQCPGGRRENVVYCGHSGLPRPGPRLQAAAGCGPGSRPARVTGSRHILNTRAGQCRSLGSTEPRMVSGHHGDPGTLV